MMKVKELRELLEFLPDENDVLLVIGNDEISAVQLVERCYFDNENSELIPELEAHGHDSKYLAECSQVILLDAWNREYVERYIKFLIAKRPLTVAKKPLTMEQFEIDRLTALLISEKK